MSDQAVEMSGSEVVACTGAPEQARKVKRYDFRRPDKFSLEQVRVFSMIHEIIAPWTRGHCFYADRRPCGGQRRAGRPAGVLRACGHGSGNQRLRRHSAGAVAWKHSHADRRHTCCAPGRCRRRPKVGCTHPHRSGRALSQSSKLWFWSPFCNTSCDPSGKAGESAIELNPNISAIESDPRDVQIVAPTEMIILASLSVAIGGEQANVNIALSIHYH